MTWRLSSGRVASALGASAVAALSALVFASGSAHAPGRAVSQAGPAPAGQVAAQAPEFGEAYDNLDGRRQQLVDHWVARFNKTTGLAVEAGPFYDTYIRFSAKTTFDAVTHALMTTPMTDTSGASLGDALDLVDRVDAVHGQIPGVSGDRQFRMYVTLKPGARATLDRSQQFKRGRDNTVYHKGYPLSYREQGGTPSIQVSMALDDRHADVDVDYRSSSFPAAIFNGHLTAANSDVRAGDNFDRHSTRWDGFQNWWRGFFGVRLERLPDDPVKDGSFTMPSTPRAGKQPIDAIVADFLKAWLVEGDAVAAMGYISNRAYACLAEEMDDPAAFDRGMAIVQLMMRLKASHGALGPHASLEGLAVGVRLSTPALKVVQQPHHAQFVVYAVPDDVAARFDCASRLRLGNPAKARRVYGNYYGSVFHVGPAGRTVALLWAKEQGYWKMVSWQTDTDDEADKAKPATDVKDAMPQVTIARVKAEPGLAQAARQFLESWLVRKDYPAAFAALAPESYGCYNASRSPGVPAAATPEEAGPRILAGLERVATTAGPVTNLDALVTAAEPVHPAVQLMEHAAQTTFTLVSYPDSFGEAAGCAAPVVAPRSQASVPLEYGKIFGMNIRFLTESGEGPVMRTIWAKTASGWRITSYHIEYP
jgi:hypothetical protein